MSAIYVNVSEVTIIGEFRNSSGLVDPTTITGYTLVNGTETSYLYPGNPAITRLGVGRYQLIFTPGTVGRWLAGIRGTGSNKGGAYMEFEVAAWPFS